MDIHGIDDKVSLQKVTNVAKAEQIIIAPSEELNILGLEDLTWIT
jgi:hypothetical protein